MLRKVVLQLVRPVAYAEGFGLYGKPMSVCSCGHTDVFINPASYLNPVYASNASVRATTHHCDQIQLATERQDWHAHEMTFYPL